MTKLPKSIELASAKDGSKRLTQETVIITLLAAARTKFSVKFTYESEADAKSKFDTIKKTIKTKGLSEKVAAELDGSKVVVTRL